MCTGPYESQTDKYAIYDNRTMIKLNHGEMCEITVDATQGIARVIFEEYYPSDALGIWEYPKYF